VFVDPAELAASVDGWGHSKGQCRWNTQSMEFRFASAHSGNTKLSIDPDLSNADSNVSSRQNLLSQTPHNAVIGTTVRGRNLKGRSISPTADALTYRFGFDQSDGWQMLKKLARARANGREHLS
jgi:hypothetical protein